PQPAAAQRAVGDGDPRAGAVPDPADLYARRRGDGVGGVKRPYHADVVMWALRFVGLVAFQALVAARRGLIRPDHALFWTADETMALSQRGKPTLLDPFMNAHVAWDSEFYLSIALNGYDDPAVRAIGPADAPLTLNYAFMPFYPLVVRVVAWPL